MAGSRSGLRALARRAKRLLARLLGRRSGSSVPPAVAAGRAIVANAMAGIRERGELPVPDGGRVAVLAYHPRVVTNPYQRMLYARCRSEGIIPVNLSHVGGLSETAHLRALGAEVVFHIHWTHKVLAGATDAQDARRRVRAFEATLDRFRGDGGLIAWTLHNVLPHEHRFRDEEVAVCEALARRADAIHVMCDQTAAATAEAGYTLPEDKLHLIPHASYLGVYPNYVPQVEARAQLGLSPDHTVLTVFGGIRRYKGLTLLLEAFGDAAADDPNLRLVIAGRPIAYDDVEELRAACERHPQITAHLDTVPDEDVQRYLNAADAVVLPHQTVLNSGLVGLAFAFARPVIAPRVGCVTPHVSDEVGVLFEPGDRASLREALAGATGLRGDRYRGAALERARQNSPDAMAGRFATMIRSVVTSEATT